MATNRKTLLDKLHAVLGEPAHRVLDYRTAGDLMREAGLGGYPVGLAEQALGEAGYCKLRRLPGSTYRYSVWMRPEAILARCARFGVTPPAGVDLL